MTNAQAANALRTLRPHKALKSLAALNARKRQIVELQFFGGLTNEERTEILGISLSTVEREWRSAKVLLQHKLERH